MIIKFSIDKIIDLDKQISSLGEGMHTIYVKSTDGETHRFDVYNDEVEAGTRCMVVLDHYEIWDCLLKGACTKFGHPSMIEPQSYGFKYKIVCQAYGKD